MGKNSKNRPYISPCPGEFPLIGYGPTRHHVIPGAEDFKQFKDCGFNVAMYPGPHHPADVEGIMLDTMKNALESGINVIVFDQALTALSDIDLDITNWMVKEFRDWNNLAGWNVMDEPKFNWIKPSVDASVGDGNVIKNACERVSKLDPNHMAYFNMAAAVSKEWTGGLSYPEYLETVQEVIAPPVWSFDFYPIIGTKTPEGVAENLKVRPEWFDYLQYFRNISKQTNRPFWSYCLSTEHYSVKENVAYPIPTVSFLRFAAFTALAYGAQGLVFWTYCQLAGGEDWRFVSAPVDLEGRKTEIWNNVQKVVGEIRALQDVFLGNVVRDVIHIFGDMVNPYPGVKEASCVKNNLLMSFMGTNNEQDAEDKRNEYEWVVLVNKDPFHEQKVSVSFEKEMQVVAMGGGNYNEFHKPSGTVFELVLDAGSYAIMKKVI